MDKLKSYSKKKLYECKFCNNKVSADHYVPFYKVCETCMMDIMEKAAEQSILTAGEAVYPFILLTDDED